MLIVNFLIFIQLWSIVFNRLLEDSDTEEKCGIQISNLIL
jgi:hypothetical protein